MIMKKLSIVLFGLWMSISASPLPSRVKYDQRQEGDLNVRADLENFVILVIPTSQGSAASSLGLLDLLTKAIPLRAHVKPGKHVRKNQQQSGTTSTRRKSDEPAPETDEETQAFIESKTAPYHVDITKSRKNLAKLHPVPAPQQRPQQEELLISPNLSIIKTEEDGPKGRVLRAAKGYVLSLPLEVDEATVRIDNRRIEKSNYEKDYVRKLEIKENYAKEKRGDGVLSLLGAGHKEECGPGYERDAKGVCKFVEHV